MVRARTEYGNSRTAHHRHRAIADAKGVTFPRQDYSFDRQHMTQVRRNLHADPRQFARAVVLILWAVAVGWLTLSPSGGGASPTSPFCVLCGSRGTADLLLNVVLFAPLGWALGYTDAARRPAILGVFLLGALLSLGIEAAQLFIPGRAPTLRDVVANSLGAGGGWLLAARFSVWADRWRATRLTAALAVMMPAAAVALHAWLLVPYVAPVPLWGQWTPDLGRLERWQGQVESLQLGEQPIPIGRLSAQADSTRAIRSALVQRAVVRVSATLGDTPKSLAPIVGIADARSEHLLLVGQWGDDLVVRRFVRGSQLRLETPADRIPGVFLDRRAGDRITLELTWQDGRSCASINEQRVCSAPPHGQRLWAFLLWSATEYPWLGELLDLLLSAVLWLPLAWILPQWGRTLGFVLFLAAAALSLAAHRVSPVGMLSVADVLGAMLAAVLVSRYRGNPSRQQTDYTASGVAV